MIKNSFENTPAVAEEEIAAFVDMLAKKWFCGAGTGE
jgi:hypothetical protein